VENNFAEELSKLYWQNYTVAGEATGSSSDATEWIISEAGATVSVKSSPITFTAVSACVCSRFFTVAIPASLALKIVRLLNEPYVLQPEIQSSSCLPNPSGSGRRPDCWKDCL
jgi:hypothetical protein